METTSPPLTPIRQYMSPLETSPANSFRRRNSSFSSNHDRSSPVSIRSRKRFSNASQGSVDFATDGGGGSAGGMGNLADELGDLDDEEETVLDGDEMEEDEEQQRDSGIDVSYPSSTTGVKNFSKPFAIAEDRRDEEAASAAEAKQEEDRLSPDLERLIKDVAHMSSYAATTEDPLIPRVLALLQDLGNQTQLETGIQRLNTSTNSMTAHLTSQSRELQGLMTSLYSPLALLTTPLDPATIEEAIPLIDALVTDLPHPDPAPLQGVQKLVRETDSVIQTLSQLTDTVQMGKHTTNAASRHLRTTQTMVAESRRERERAETAREDLNASPWPQRIGERWCAGECKDIMGGFERRCEELRQGLVEAGGP